MEECARLGAAPRAAPQPLPAPSSHWRSRSRLGEGPSAASRKGLSPVRRLSGHVQAWKAPAAASSTSKAEQVQARQGRRRQRVSQAPRGAHLQHPLAISNAFTPSPTLGLRPQCPAAPGCRASCRVLVIQTNCKHFYSFFGPYINSCDESRHVVCVMKDTEAVESSRTSQASPDTRHASGGSGIFWLTLVEGGGHRPAGFLKRLRTMEIDGQGDVQPACRPASWSECGGQAPRGSESDSGDAGASKSDSDRPSESDSDRPSESASDRPSESDSDRPSESDSDRPSESSLS